MTLTDFNGERGQAIGKVARAYEEIMSRLLNGLVLGDIEYYIDRGCEADLIIKAIDITAGKGADWRYTKAILQRCCEEGIYTEYEFDFGVRVKKGIAEFKREFQQYGELDHTPLSLYLAINHFKEDMEACEKDCEEYVKAVSNGGDISKWENRWSKFQKV